MELKLQTMFRELVGEGQKTPTHNSLKNVWNLKEVMMISYIQEGQRSLDEESGSAKATGKFRGFSLQECEMICIATEVYKNMHSVIEGPP